MNLLKILSKVNQIEKISFLKILDGFCTESRKITPQVDHRNGVKSALDPCC